MPEHHTPSQRSDRPKTVRDRRYGIETPDGGLIPKKPLVEGTHWEVDADTGCWNWLQYLMYGYGRHRFGQAHRVVWRQHGRTIPEGMDLHHKCENTRCVNPDHMEPLHKPSHVQEHKRAVVEMSDEEREAIRQAGLDPNLSQQDIADRFNVPRPTVNKILNGYSWYGGERVLPERDCRGCGEHFQTTNRRQFFCTRECQRSYNRVSRRAA